MNYGNFPEQLWTRLKSWAELISAADEAPALEECENTVKDMTRLLTGSADSIGLEVVRFYASEVSEMIARHRAVRAVAAAEEAI